MTAEWDPDPRPANGTAWFSFGVFGSSDVSWPSLSFADGFVSSAAKFTDLEVIYWHKTGIISAKSSSAPF